MVSAEAADDANFPPKVVDRIKSASVQLDKVLDRAKAYFDKKKAPKKKLQQLFKFLKEAFEEAETADKIVTQLLPREDWDWVLVNLDLYIIQVYLEPWIGLPHGYFQQMTLLWLY